MPGLIIPEHIFKKKRCHVEKIECRLILVEHQCEFSNDEIHWNLSALGWGINANIEIDTLRSYKQKVFEMRMYFPPGRLVEPGPIMI